MFALFALGLWLRHVGANGNARVIGLLFVGMLAAGIILAIMITPTISSISREVFRAVPVTQREAALALGSTRWEMMRLAVLKSARRGVVGAAILGLGRALGETMAVTMVIGNRHDVSFSLFAPGAVECANPVFTSLQPLGEGGTATSGPFTNTQSGVYRWTALYGGDDNNLPAMSGCDAEQVTITSPPPQQPPPAPPPVVVAPLVIGQPTIATLPDPTTTSASSGAPATLRDTATVSGGNSPTGSVTFTLYAPGDDACTTPIFVSTVPLVGNTALSDPFQTTDGGTFHWVATYNGDADDAPATSGCADEPVFVSLVLGVQFAAPRVLAIAATGMEIRTLALVGLVLFGIGFVLLGAASRPEPVLISAGRVSGARRRRVRRERLRTSGAARRRAGRERGPPHRS
jgi:hypothetical protein